MQKRTPTNKRASLRQRRRAVSKVVKKGIVSILSTFNNVVITLADTNGNVCAWASAGNTGFKGAKKATPFAATQTAKMVIEKAQALGLEEAKINIRGVGNGREAAVRAFSGSGINITDIKDLTPIPHNGCRPKKPRRV